MRAPRRSPILLDASISMRVTTVGGEGKNLRGYGISGREHRLFLRVRNRVQPSDNREKIHEKPHEKLMSDNYYDIVEQSLC